MKILLAAILFVIPGLLLADVHLQWSGTVAGAPDGNTLVISDDGSQPPVRRVVTLDGVQAPATNTAAGVAARERLAALTKGKQVRVEQTGSGDRVYGTWVILREGGQVVNLMLVQEGLASLARIRGYPPREIDRNPEMAAEKMAAAQAEARRQERGMWKKEPAPETAP